MSVIELSSIRRILVPELAGMGNGLMTTPMLRQLKHAAPTARLTVVARNASIAGVFERLPEVDEVKVVGEGRGAADRLVKACRQVAADLCVVPFPSNRWQYSVLAMLSRARHVVMHDYPIGYWRALHMLPPTRITRIPARDDLHDVEQNLALLRPLGIEPNRTMAPIFPLNEADRERAERRLREVEIEPGFIAIHAGSGRTVFALAKRWPPEKFADVIRPLRAAGRQVLVLEGPEDDDAGQRVASLANVPVLRLVGPLAEAAAVLEHASFYVGSDSGLAHLAAAVDTPPVTLFGPAWPQFVAPFDHADLVVQTPAACAPCFRYPLYATTPHVACRPPMCIDRIAVDRVMAAIERADAKRVHRERLSSS